jgi:hypothetical protein
MGTFFCGSSALNRAGGAQENSVIPRSLRLMASFVLRGVGISDFWYGRRSEGEFPLRRKLTEFNAVTKSLSRFLSLCGNGSFGGI